MLPELRWLATFWKNTFEGQRDEKESGVGYFPGEVNVKGKPRNASLQNRPSWNISVKKERFTP